MAENDTNIIKPVDGLQNMAGLTPARRREQRKRRQDLNKENEQETEQTLDESVDEEIIDGECTENGNNQHIIDYRA